MMVLLGLIVYFVVLAAGVYEARQAGEAFVDKNWNEFFRRVWWSLFALGLALVLACNPPH